MNQNSDNAEKKQQRWVKGQSGNPAGKPPGTKHKATLAAQVLLDGEAEALTRKAIELALQGDLTALRLCLDRILPPAKERPIKLPAMVEGQKVLEWFKEAMPQLAGGQYTPQELQAAIALAQAYTQSLDTYEFDQRLLKLEGTAR